MTTLREAAQQALEALEGVVSAHAYESGTPVEAITALRAALAEPVQKPPCATKECMPSECPNCASLEAQNTELDRKLAELEEGNADELTVAYMMGAQARRRLTDAEVGEVWFAAKIPGLTETNARLLIRAAERRLAGEK